MRDRNASILIVDRAPELRRLLCRLISEEGFVVLDAGDIVSATGLVQTRYPDAVILDPDLPDGDGLALIREIRTRSDTPILILTERNQEDIKVAAFAAGADDYVVKPFGSRELLARIKVQLRHRANRLVAGEETLSFGDIHMNVTTRVVTKNGQSLHLTPIEYRLLCLLARCPQRVLTHKELLHTVWGGMHDEDTHYLRVYMRSLRKKIESNPAHPKHIRTENNVGYRFVP